jgi:uncharacterized protein
MTSQAEALYHLQEIDLNLLRRKKRLGEIVALLSDNQHVAAAQAQVKMAENAVSPLQTRIRNFELEIQSTRQKAQAAEDQLYSGKVKNPKQMQEMQEEIAALQRRTSELEEQMLETMVGLEDAQGVLDAAKNTLQVTIATHQSSHTHLLEEQAHLEAELEHLGRQRIDALKSVEPDSLNKYNTLRPKKNNQPVAVMRGNSCTVCGVEQTLAIEREAQLAHSLVNCLSCGRILVYKV